MSDLAVTHTVIYILRIILDEIFGLMHCTEQAPEDQDVVNAELVRVQWCMCSASSCGSNLMVVSCYCCLRFTQLIL